MWVIYIKHTRNIDFIIFGSRIVSMSHRNILFIRTEAIIRSADENVLNTILFLRRTFLGEMINNNRFKRYSWFIGLFTFGKVQTSEASGGENIIIYTHSIVIDNGSISICIIN